MPDISLSTNSIVINGHPALIQARKLDYFHLPHQTLWKPALDKMHVEGFNAVLIAFPWSYHSPAEGFYDFTGPRDLQILLNAVEDAGLWLICHIGPWIDYILEAGGIPPWVWKVPDTISTDSTTAQSGPSPVFLQHATSWWQQLFPFFIHRPNHVLSIINPGRWSFPIKTEVFKQPLCELAIKCGHKVPFAWPVDEALSGKSNGSVFELWFFGKDNRFVEAPTHTISTPRLTFIREEPPAQRYKSNQLQQFADVEDAHSHPNTAPLISGARTIVMDPSHNKSYWGYWTALELDLLRSEELSHKVNNNDHGQIFHRSTIVAETISRILFAAETQSTIYASPEDSLKACYCTAVGSVAFLESSTNVIEQVRLSQPIGDEMIITDEIHLPEKSTKILPINLSLAGGILKSTTLELILITEIAGRTLCILHNVNGGSIQLSDHFRPQHIRGDVHTERFTAGLWVHFDPGRLHSIVLDTPEQKVQFLALDTYMADRVWSMDDSWRLSPSFPAKWSPTNEDPVRGVIIGPDLVIPKWNGGFKYLISNKGFGYRWGPWRGSDPRTWLAPFSWRAPDNHSLPLLNWEHKSGALELLPEYPDVLWRVVPENSALAMENFDIIAGFIWYRGSYSGSAEDITLLCRHDCDVFLNGHLIAALKTSPDLGNGGLKTIPIPARHQQQRNVLSILVENAGRAAELDFALQPHGLLTCKLNDDIPIQWRIRGGLQGEKHVQGFYGYADWHLIPHNGTPHITWHRSAFELSIDEDLELSIFLLLDPTPGKLYLYLNGVLIGRSGNKFLSQQKYWLPEGLLNLQGHNELLVMQWTRGGEPLLGLAQLVSTSPSVWYSEFFATS